MQTTEYLYGCKSTDFCNLLYKDALIYKCKCADKLVRKLLHDEKSATNEEWMQINAHIKAVCDAKRFNETLLKELND